MTEDDFANAEKEEYLKEPIEDENIDPSLIEEDMVFYDEHNTSEYEDEDYELDIVDDPSRKWPKEGDDVIIPFEIKPDLAKGIKARIAKAVLELQKNTCIKYVNTLPRIANYS